ncbi:silencing defective 5 [Prunus dulcis]|uniref:Silencing defective 5 n=1 Tax=Prunus dulcis TaxID=3755 RepID=A0A4Y1RC42_PRUDU|nr:silencing defective 5 [Prunus dulcis]
MELYIKMQAFSSPTASDDDQKRDLEYLLEVFSSMCSLMDIASAYCQARQNVEMAAEILCASHVSPSDGAGSSKVKFEGASATSSEGMSSDKVLQNPLNGAGNTRASKSKKKFWISGSCFRYDWKEYIRPRSSANESIEVKKPLKLELKEVPVSEIWSEEVESTMPAENSKMHADIEEFLFKMLGEGFKLDKDVIREVLGHCGYDVQKVSFSFNAFPSQLRKYSYQRLGQSIYRDESRSTFCHSKSPIEEKDGLVLQKEVLEALFHVPERSEEAPKRSHPMLGGSKEVMATVYGGYNLMLAFDAFCEGDRVRTDKLLEEGHFYSRKAQEADEKYAQKLLEAQSSCVL